MSRISLRLPDSLHKQLRALAQKEGISINQLAASALSEKMAALALVPSDPPAPRDTLV